MAHRVEVARIREELVDAIKFGEEERARRLLSQLDLEPWGARAMVEAMLEDEDSLVRQAAVFGLGEFGGADSVGRLEQQLLIEETRGDYDGEAVVEDIIRALGRIDEPGARQSLVRRLERMTAGRPERSDVNMLALALWQRRSPELIPPVCHALERLTLRAPHGLHGLRVLLETPVAEDFRTWARDLDISLALKTEVLALLTEELPDELVSTLSAFVLTAQRLSEEEVRQEPEAEFYCEGVFRLLLLEWARVEPILTEEEHGALRAACQRLISATYPNPSLWAARMLQRVGRPEDAHFLEAHCPADPIPAKVFHEASRALLASGGNG